MRKAVKSVVLVGLSLAFAGGPAGLRSQESDDREAKLRQQEQQDSEFQQSAPGYGFRNHVGFPQPNVELPKHVRAKPGELTLFADFNRAGETGVPLYLVNRTGEEVTLPCQDHDIYLKLEFRDAEGRWIRAQNHVRSWCGNSYYAVKLGAGQHLAFHGYLPVEGTPATVRYRTADGKQLVSNTGKGRYLEADRIAASLDSLSSQAVPGAIGNTLHPGSYPNRHGMKDSSRYLAALSLLSRYAESAYYRRAVDRHKETWEKWPEADDISRVLESTWPAEKDPVALFHSCLASISNGKDALSTPAIRKHPDLAWDVIRDLMRPRLQPEDPGDDWPPLVRRAFDALPGSIESPDEKQSSAASKLLELDDLADEHVPDEALIKWVESGNSMVVKICAATLARRGRYQSLAERGMSMTPEKQLLLLRELAKGRAHPNGYRNPGVGIELDFWKQCADEQPVKTVQALFHTALWGADQRNRLNLFLHDTLRAYLEKEAELGATDPDAVENEEHGYPVAQVIRFVGGWQRKEDIPIFQKFLEHPGYQVSWSQDEKDQWYEDRRYRVREDAKQVLISMGIAVDEGVVLEEKAYGTELPEFLKDCETDRKAGGPVF